MYKGSCPVVPGCLVSSVLYTLLWPPVAPMGREPDARTVVWEHKGRAFLRDVDERHRHG